MVVDSGRPCCGELHLEEESCVLDEGPEDEEDAHDDPGLDGGQTLGLREWVAIKISPYLPYQ